MRMNDISFLGKCHDNNSHVRDDYPISKEEQHKDQSTGSVKAKFYMICNVNLMIKMDSTSGNYYKIIRNVFIITYHSSSIWGTTQRDVFQELRDK